MINIYVLGFNQALSSAITGIVDLFSLAGVTWNRIQKEDINTAFNIQLASEDAQSIQCINGLTINAHCSFSDIEKHIDDSKSEAQSNMVIVPTIGGPIEQTLHKNNALLRLLRKANEANWIIAGNCTGNFLLAQSGILKQRTATTHWGFAKEFELRFPDVQLKAEQLITRDHNIFCAGGGIAWFDLGLHMIERSVDFETAMQTAKAFVIDYRRDSQLSYSLMRISQPHQDELIQRIQDDIQQDCSQSINITKLTKHLGISQRTLIRRFNNALGVPPNTYLQAVRIENAKKMLEESEFNIDVIMNKVGYEDTSSFRRLFKKSTGLTPTEYRKRFYRRL